MKFLLRAIVWMVLAVLPCLAAPPAGGLKFNAYTTNTTADADARVAAISGGSLGITTNGNNIFTGQSNTFTGQLNGNTIRSTNIWDSSNVKFWGANPAYGVDNLPALQLCVSNSAPGGLLYIPAGSYGLSDTLTINGAITIDCEGSSQEGTVVLYPMASVWPAGHPLIHIITPTNGWGFHTIIRNMCADMGHVPGNWLSVDTSNHGGIIERNYILGVADGYWAIQLNDNSPGGYFGVHGVTIQDNLFQGFTGGGIYGAHMADGSQIIRNYFLLGDSKSWAIKWVGSDGGACCNFANNIITSAARGVLISNCYEFKFTGNQYEAYTQNTNAEKAMLVVSGPTFGSRIADNNFNGHLWDFEGVSVTNAIYLDRALNCVIDNNTFFNVDYAVATTDNSSRIRYFAGHGVETFNDIGAAISRVDGHGTNIVRGPIMGKAEGLQFRLGGGSVGQGMSIGWYIGDTGYALNRIESIFDSSYRGDLVFYGGYGGNLYERMRMTGDGNFGIGTPDPVVPMQIAGETFISDAESSLLGAVSPGFGTLHVMRTATTNVPISYLTFERSGNGMFLSGLDTNNSLVWGPPSNFTEVIVPYMTLDTTANLHLGGSYYGDGSHLTGPLTAPTIILTNNPTFQTTNAAPTGYVLGVTVPTVWFAFTNAGKKYLIPGFPP